MLFHLIHLDVGARRRWRPWATRRMRSKSWVDGAQMRSTVTSRMMTNLSVRRPLPCHAPRHGRCFKSTLFVKTCGIIQYIHVEHIVCKVCSCIHVIPISYYSVFATLQSPVRIIHWAYVLTRGGGGGSQMRLWVGLGARVLSRRAGTPRRVFHILLGIFCGRVDSCFVRNRGERALGWGSRVQLGYARARGLCYI